MCANSSSSLLVCLEHCTTNYIRLLNDQRQYFSHRLSSGSTASSQVGSQVVKNSCLPHLCMRYRNVDRWIQAVWCLDAMCWSRYIHERMPLCQSLFAPFCKKEPCATQRFGEPVHLLLGCRICRGQKRYWIVSKTLEPLRQAERRRASLSFVPRRQYV